MRTKHVQQPVEIHSTLVKRSRETRNNEPGTNNANMRLRDDLSIRRFLIDIRLVYVESVDRTHRNELCRSDARTRHEDNDQHSSGSSLLQRSLFAKSPYQERQRRSSLVRG